MSTGPLYTAGGEPIGVADATERLAGADVILFGELHGNPAAHAMERELASELLRREGRSLVLGAEMFEADDQLVLDEYLSGTILHHHLTSEAKVWDNYESDYRPLVELAKEFRRPFVATNAPRRYANLVAREGLDALRGLAAEALRYLAPLPVRLDLDAPGYREMLEMPPRGMPGMGISPGNLVAAQAVKDATMAHFIASRRGAGQRFLHFNGVFHSQRGGGIGWFLTQAEPGLRVATLSTVIGDPAAFEPDFEGLGDVVLVVDAG